MSAITKLRRKAAFSWISLSSYIRICCRLKPILQSCGFVQLLGIVYDFLISNVYALTPLKRRTFGLYISMISDIGAGVGRTSLAGGGVGLEIGKKLIFYCEMKIFNSEICVCFGESKNGRSWSIVFFELIKFFKTMLSTTWCSKASKSTFEKLWYFFPKWINRTKMNENSKILDYNNRRDVRRLENSHQ